MRPLTIYPYRDVYIHISGVTLNVANCHLTGMVHLHIYLQHTPRTRSYQVQYWVPSFTNCPLTWYIYLQYTPASCSILYFSTIPSTIKNTKLHQLLPGILLHGIFTWHGIFTCNTHQHVALNYTISLLYKVQYKIPIFYQLIQTPPDLRWSTAPAHRERRRCCSRSGSTPQQWGYPILQEPSRRASCR